MTVLNPKRTKDYRFLEKMFWHTLSITLERALDASPELANKYRASLRKAPPEERLLALHDDPLDVAAVLVGVSITPQISRRYEEILEDLSRDDMNPAMAAVESPPRVRRLFKPLYDRRPRERLSALISYSHFTQIMEELGYRESRSDDLVYWRIDPNFQVRRGMPTTVTTVFPGFRTVYNEPAYEKGFVIDLFNYILSESRQIGAPTETLRLIETQREKFAAEFG